MAGKHLTLEDRIIKLELLQGIGEIPKEWAPVIIARAKEIYNSGVCGMHGAKLIAIKEYGNE